MTVFRVAAHALIEHGGRVLVVRRSARNGYRPLHWDLPGGGVEVGETVEAALLREIGEETGLAVAVDGPLYVHSKLSELPRRQWVQVVYGCRLVGPLAALKLDPEEHDCAVWVERSAAGLDVDRLARLEGEVMPYLAAFAGRGP